MIVVHVFIMCDYILMKLYSIIVSIWLHWEIFTFGHSSLLETVRREMPLSHRLVL